LRPCLTEALRSQTRSLHVEVERAGLMQELLRGRIERPAYCALLRNLQAIYAALEQGLSRHASHPAVGPVVIDGLARSRPLADDLCALHGRHWERELELMPAARAYVGHLRALALEAPWRLVGHAYVRYLGDLSGGQILGRIVADALGLPGTTGTRFYAFGTPVQASELARRLRRGLDAIDLDEASMAGLVSEAQFGFALHARLFWELMPAGQEPAARGAAA
jgi:heme oxygenase (biliverdin-producing, ferredoxin)